MNTANKRFTIGVLFRGLTAGLAEDVGDVRMAQHILQAAEISSYRPWTTESGDRAKALAQELWDDYIEEMLEAIELIHQRINQTPHRGQNRLLLSDVAFRSACRLVGADEGARVRLYDENGLGIIFPDDFKGWIDDAPFHFVGYTVVLP